MIDLVYRVIVHFRDFDASDNLLDTSGTLEDGREWWLLQVE
jgi:hypothetical protein